VAFRNGGHRVASKGDETLGVWMLDPQVAQALEGRGRAQVGGECDRGLEKISVHQRIDQGSAFELLRGHRGAGDDHVEGGLQTYGARKQLSTVRTGYEAELHLRKGELRLRDGEAVVASERDLQAAPARGAVDRGDNRLGAGLDGSPDGAEVGQRKSP